MLKKRIKSFTHKLNDDDKCGLLNGLKRIAWKKLVHAGAGTMDLTIRYPRKKKSHVLRCGDRGGRGTLPNREICY